MMSQVRLGVSEVLGLEEAMVEVVMVRRVEWEVSGVANQGVDPTDK